MQKDLKKLVLASLLASISIVIDVLVNVVIPVDNFGIPIYALPIIIGAHILGPISAGAIGLVSDVVSFLIYGKGSFSILFSLSAIMWGVVSGLVLKKRKVATIYVLMIVFIAHVVATLTNTIALALLVSKNYAIANLTLRITMIPVNTIILTVLYQIITKRLNRQIEEFIK